MIILNVRSFSDRVNDFLLKDTLPVELLNKKLLSRRNNKVFYALYGGYKVAQCLLRNPCGDIWRELRLKTFPLS